MCCVVLCRRAEHTEGAGAEDAEHVLQRRHRGPPLLSALCLPVNRLPCFSILCVRYHFVVSFNCLFLHCLSIDCLLFHPFFQVEVSAPRLPGFELASLFDFSHGRPLFEQKSPCNYCVCRVLFVALFAECALCCAAKTPNWKAAIKPGTGAKARALLDAFYIVFSTNSHTTIHTHTHKHTHTHT